MLTIMRSFLSGCGNPCKPGKSVKVCGSHAFFCSMFNGCYNIMNDHDQFWLVFCSFLSSKTVDWFHLSICHSVGLSLSVVDYCEISSFPINLALPSCLHAVCNIRFCLARRSIVLAFSSALLLASDLLWAASIVGAVVWLFLPPSISIIGWLLKHNFLVIKWPPLLCLLCQRGINKYYFIARIPLKTRALYGKLKLYDCSHTRMCQLLLNTQATFRGAPLRFLLLVCAFQHYWKAYLFISVDINWAFISIFLSDTLASLSLNIATHCCIDSLNETGNEPFLKDGSLMWSPSVAHI